MTLLGKIESPSNRGIHIVRRFVELSGWCLQQATGRTADRIFVRVGKRVIECERVARPDLSRQAGALSPDCGYQARFKVGRGLKLIRVYAVFEGRTTRIGTFLVYRKKSPFAVPPEQDYADWIRRYDTPGPEALAAMRQAIGRFSQRPVISIVMPVYNPPEHFLREAIESVRQQVYEHWELCIADDASTLPGVKSVLAAYERADPRIRVAYREVNGHISAASNSALELATGEWVALLDQDDLLPAHALYCLAERIEREPHLRLIYSDEDRFDDVRQIRFGPYFKTDWNPDLFLSQNMFSHLGAYRTDLLREVGGFRTGYEGAQDYDLALRCSEVVPPEAIGHIPRVLYHWRVHPESTSSGNEAKPYVMDAGARALNDHLSRAHPGAEASWLGYGYRVRYPLPTPPPRVSWILPVFDLQDLRDERLSALLANTDYPDLECLLVDLRPEDGPPLVLPEDPHARHHNIRILRSPQTDHPGRSVNAAVEACQGELVALLSPKLEVITPGWLREMAAHATRPGIGCVGARLWYPDGTIRHAGTILGLGAARCAGQFHYRHPRWDHGYFGRLSLCSNYSAVSGDCLLIRKSTFREVGGLDESGRAGSLTDLDFCLKVGRAGYRHVVTPDADLYRHDDPVTAGSTATSHSQPTRAEIDFMREKWGRALAHDPLFSPNLSLDSPHGELAFSPRIRLWSEVTDFTTGER